MSWMGTAFSYELNENVFSNENDLFSFPDTARCTRVPSFLKVEILLFFDPWSDYEVASVNVAEDDVNISLSESSLYFQSNLYI
jgi:hypothetical protein